MEKVEEARGELMERLKVLRRRVSQLPSKQCLVGWFTPNAEVVEGGTGRLVGGMKCCPLSWMEVSFIRYYRGETHEMSRQVSLVATHGDSVRGKWNGTIHIGGPDWTWFLEGGRMLHFTREPNMPRAQPVGSIRNAFSDSYSMPAPGRSNPYEGYLTTSYRMANQALALTEAPYLQAGEYKTSDGGVEHGFYPIPDGRLILPRFMAPVEPFSYLTLRDGPFLENLVLTYARTGSWKLHSPHNELHSIVSPGKGGVSEVTKESVVIDVGEEDGPYRDSFSIAHAVRQIEARIHTVFGTHVYVELVPIVNNGEAVVRHHTLFAPVPKRDWTLPELKSHPMWNAMKFMAALTTTSCVNNNKFMLDWAVAFGSQEPWVDLTELAHPVQKVEYEYQKFSRRQDHPLVVTAPGVECDLARTAIEHTVNTQRQEVQHRTHQQQQQRKRRGNTIESVMPAGLTEHAVRASNS